MLGLLVELNDGKRYRVKSNLESGKGRYDVMLKSLNHESNDLSIIMEFKKDDTKSKKNNTINQSAEGRSA